MNSDIFYSIHKESQDSLNLLNQQIKGVQKV